MPMMCTRAWKLPAAVGLPTKRLTPPSAALNVPCSSVHWGELSDARQAIVTASSSPQPHQPPTRPGSNSATPALPPTRARRAREYQPDTRPAPRAPRLTTRRLRRPTLLTCSPVHTCPSPCAQAHRSYCCWAHCRCVQDHAGHVV